MFKLQLPQVPKDIKEVRATFAKPQEIIGSKVGAAYDRVAPLLDRKGSSMFTGWTPGKASELKTKVVESTAAIKEYSEFYEEAKGYAEQAQVAYNFASLVAAASTATTATGAYTFGAAAVGTVASAVALPVGLTVGYMVASTVLERTGVWEPRKKADKSKSPVNSGSPWQSSNARSRSRHRVRGTSRIRTRPDIGDDQDLYYPDPDCPPCPRCPRQ